MVEVICKLSGLRFEAKTKRSTVHPEVASWKTYANKKGWYGRCLEALDFAKERGIETTEQLDLLMSQAQAGKKLSLEPATEIAWNFEGDWVARIEGAHAKFRFTRSFLEPVEQRDRFNRYNVTEDGVYELCYKSAKGNESRYYRQIVSGESRDLTLEQVEAIFPQESLTGVSGYTKVESWVGKVGEIVEIGGSVFEVIRVDESSRWAEDWDDASDEYHRWKEPVYESWVKPVSSEVETSYRQEQQQLAEQKAAIKAAKEQLIAIAKTITPDNSIRPVSGSYPKGIEFVTREGFYQANEILLLESDSNRLWKLIYNGRDGDDWSYNNVSSQWVGYYLEIDPDRFEEIKSLINLVAK